MIWPSWLSVIRDSSYLRYSSRLLQSYLVLDSFKCFLRSLCQEEQSTCTKNCIHGSTFLPNSLALNNIFTNMSWHIRCWCPCHWISRCCDIKLFKLITLETIYYLAPNKHKDLWMWLHPRPPHWIIVFTSVEHPHCLSFEWIFMLQIFSRSKQYLTYYNSRIWSINASNHHFNNQSNTMINQNLIVVSRRQKLVFDWYLCIS